MEKNFKNNNVRNVTTVYNLNDYTYLPSNRGDKDWAFHANRKKIDSIKERYLKDLPVEIIILNRKTHHIISGNHHALSANELWNDGWKGGVMVRYLSMNDEEERDYVRMMETSRNTWKGPDILQYFADSGDADAEKVIDFCEKHRDILWNQKKKCWRTRIVYTLLSERHSAHDVKDGKIPPATDEAIARAELKIDELERLKSINQSPKQLSERYVWAWLQFRKVLISNNIPINKYLSFIPIAKKVGKQTGYNIGYEYNDSINEHKLKMNTMLMLYNQHYAPKTTTTN